MMIQSNRFLLIVSATAAAFLFAPSAAEASWLPGWGSQDGTPGVDPEWCHGTGNRLYVGDFDGNGHTDLLCHTDTTGRRRVDLAYSSYRGFWGTNWDSATDGGAEQDWCTDAGETIHIGDFNGDGRDDLLCRVPRGYTNAGRKRIDFADANGQFDGTDFDTFDWPSAAQTWCTNSGEIVEVGDFNGDGKDDLLCWVPPGYTNAGRKRLDYANSAGTFFGTEYDTLSHPAVEQDWCSDSGEVLHIGDYNGDGKDDLLCFVNRGHTNAGRRRIDFYGSVSEPFAGEDFNSQDWPTATQSWCAQYGDELHVGRLDGDSKDDLICTNWYSSSTNGTVRVDHANSSGTFFGTNADVHDEDWCQSTYANFHVGDYDADGRADLLCHDPTDGYRSIRYGSSDGDFYSVCSDDSTMGDGELPPLPVHFAVVADPDHPDATDRKLSSHPLVSATSDHIHPFDGTNIDNDAYLYFEAELEVMNHYNYAVGGPGFSVCFLADCIDYEYESHALYDDISDTSCDEVLNYSNYPDLTYAPGCWSNPAWQNETEAKAECYPQSCGYSPDADEFDTYNFAFECAIKTCTDKRIRKPGTLNVVVYDRCGWDTNSNGITNTTCDDEDMSFGFGGSRFLTGWDYKRMLRGTHASSPPRSGAKGVEQHELGHTLNLGHVNVCDPMPPTPGVFEENPMDTSSSDCDDGMGTSANTDGDGIAWREGGYHTSINGTNQIVTMVTQARSRVVAWSCN